MPAARVLSSPSWEAKEDNDEKWSRAISVIYSVRQQKTENIWGPLFQLNIEVEVAKPYVGIVLNLIDKTKPQNYFSVSNWPH